MMQEFEQVGAHHDRPFGGRVSLACIEVTAGEFILVEVGAARRVTVAAKEGRVLEERLARHDGGGTRLRQARFCVRCRANATVSYHRDVHGAHDSSDGRPVRAAAILLVLLTRAPVHRERRGTRIGEPLTQRHRGFV